MADVASNLYDWSTSAASNAPAGTTLIGTGMDDNLREMQAVIRQALASIGANIASATTTDIGAVAGLSHTITGTTTITGLGTVSAGIWKVLVFEGVLTLTHNGTSLILPGAANISTAAGDVAVVQSLGSGNWRCWFYQRASGSSVIAPSRAKIYDGTSSVTTGTTLTSGDGYRMILAGGGGTFTITMPDTATLDDGWYVRIVNNGSNLTIARSASDVFVGPGLAVATTTSFSLPYSGSGELGYNFGAVLLTKFGAVWRVDFDSASHGSQTFTSSGTWTCPFGVNTVWVSGTGAGGGGGGGNGTGSGGGGGGGQCALDSRLAVVPGTAYTVTVSSSGGAAGNSSGTNGAKGGDSSFGALLTLTGGNGGTGGVGAAGAGGAAGGTGGIAGVAGSTWTGIGYLGGAGGGTMYGASPTGLLNSAGLAGGAYGAGGSGGAGGTAGGAGGPGLIVVRW